MAHVLPSPSDLGATLHTCFRKGMDGPVSSILWNAVHLLPDAVWHKVAVALHRRLTDAGTSDAMVLRDSFTLAIKEVRDTERERSSGRQTHGHSLSILSSAADMAQVSDWIAMAYWVHATATGDWDSRNDEGRAFLAGAQFPLQAETVLSDRTGLKLATVRHERDPARGCMLTVHGSDISFRRHATLDDALTAAKAVVTEAVREKRQSIVVMSRVDGLRGAPLSSPLDADDPADKAVLDAGAAGTLIVRKSVRIADAESVEYVLVENEEGLQLRGWKADKTPSQDGNVTWVGKAWFSRLHQSFMDSKARGKSANLGTDDDLTSVILKAKPQEGGTTFEATLVYSGARDGRTGGDREILSTSSTTLPGSLIGDPAPTVEEPAVPAP